MERIQIYNKKLQIEWKQIADLRNYFTDFLEKNNNIDINKVNVIVYVISEMLENIVKYTSNHLCYLVLILEKNNDNKILHIVTENQLSSVNRKNYYNLIDIVNQVNSYQSIEEMFIELSQKYTESFEGRLNFGFALIRKLTSGNPIKLSKGTLFNPGIRVHVVMQC